MTEEVEYLCEERFRQIKQLENFIRLCESMSELQTAREAYEKGSGLGLIKYLDKKYPGIHTFGEEQKEKENG
jgi:hypothetical protein